MDKTLKIQTVCEIIENITSLNRVAEVVDASYIQLNKLVPATTFGIGLYDEHDNCLKFDGIIENGIKLPTIRQELDNDNFPSVVCFKSGEPVIINDWNKDSSGTLKERQKPVSGLASKSLVYYPLLGKKGKIGVLGVQSQRTNVYHESELEIFRLMSTTLSIALENADLYENLENKIENRTRELSLQKNIAEEYNKEISSSIEYAKRIQEATLPSQKHIDTLLKESFIFYRPKDIVSGDFYFCEAANTTTDDPTKLIVFASADCTGHGVPGAFMSIVGNNYLMQGITEASVNTCGQALDFLNMGVDKTLRQQSRDGALRDGMDISLCAWDREGMVLHFAGAKNPVYIVREIQQGDETDESNKNFLENAFQIEERPSMYLHEIKGDKHPIGAYVDDILRNFTDRSIPVKKGDMVYTFSDGFADQFGGEKGKKYNYRRFKRFLLSISKQSCEEQGQMVRMEFDRWKKDLDQLDDVLVFGTRIY